MELDSWNLVFDDNWSEIKNSEIHRIWIDKMTFALYDEIRGDLISIHSALVFIIPLLPNYKPIQYVKTSVAKICQKIVQAMANFIDLPINYLLATNHTKLVFHLTGEWRNSKQFARHSKCSEMENQLSMEKG